MSAVLEAASAGCRNSNRKMVCHDVPVSEFRMEEDGVEGDALENKTVSRFMGIWEEAVFSRYLWFVRTE